MVAGLTAATKSLVGRLIDALELVDGTNIQNDTDGSYKAKTECASVSTEVAESAFRSHSREPKMNEDECWAALKTLGLHRVLRITRRDCSAIVHATGKGSIMQTDFMYIVRRIERHAAKLRSREAAIVSFDREDKTDTLTTSERLRISRDIGLAQRNTEDEIETAKREMERSVANARASYEAQSRREDAKVKYDDTAIKARAEYISDLGKRDIEIRASQKETLAARRAADASKPDWVETLERAIDVLREFGHGQKWRSRMLTLVQYAQKALEVDNSEPFFNSVSERAAGRSRMRPGRLRDQLESVSKPVLDLTKNLCIQMDKFMFDINVMRAEDARARLRRFITFAVHIDKEYGAQELWARACEEKLIENAEIKTCETRRRVREVLRQQGSLVDTYAELDDASSHDDDQVFESYDRNGNSSEEVVAWRVYAQIDKLGKTVLVKDNQNRVEGGYVKVLADCAKIGLWIPAFEVYDILVSRRICVTARMFRLMATSCAHAKPPEPLRCYQIVCEMIKSGLTPPRSIFHLVLGSCRDQGKWRVACKTLKLMGEWCSANTCTYNTLEEIAGAAPDGDSPQIYEAFKFAGIPEKIAYACAISQQYGIRSGPDQDS